MPDDSIYFTEMSYDTPETNAVYDIEAMKRNLSGDWQLQDDNTYKNTVTQESWNPQDEYAALVQHYEDKQDFLTNAQAMYDNGATAYKPQELWDYTQTDEYKKNLEELNKATDYTAFTLSADDRFVAANAILSSLEFEDLINAQSAYNQRSKDDDITEAMKKPNATELVSKQTGKIIIGDGDKPLVDEQGRMNPLYFSEEAFDFQRKIHDNAIARLTSQGYSKEEAERYIAILQLSNDAEYMQSLNPIARAEFNKLLENNGGELALTNIAVKEASRDEFFRQAVAPLEAEGIFVDWQKDNHWKEGDDEKLLAKIEAYKEALNNYKSTMDAVNDHAIDTTTGHGTRESSIAFWDLITGGEASETENKTKLEIINKSAEQIIQRNKEFLEGDRDAMREKNARAISALKNGYERLQGLTLKELVGKDQRGFWDTFSWSGNIDDIPIVRFATIFDKDLNSSVAIREALVRQEATRKGEFKYNGGERDTLLKGDLEILRLVGENAALDEYKGKTIMGDVGEVAKESVNMAAEFAVDALVTRGAGRFLSATRMGARAARAVGLPRSVARSIIANTRQAEKTARATSKFETALSSTKNLSRASSEARQLAYNTAKAQGMTDVQAKVFAKNAAANAYKRAGKEFLVSASTTAPFLVPLTAERTVEDIYTQSGISRDEEGIPVFRPTMSYSDAYKQAYGEAAIEVLSESAGVFFSPLMGSLGRAVAKVPGARWVGKGLGKLGGAVGSTADKLGYARIRPAVNFLQKYSGFSGIAGESFEERVGDVARALTGVSSDDPIAERFGEMFNEWTDGKRWATELLAFAIMPVGHIALGALFETGKGTINAVERRQALTELFGKDARREGKIILDYMKAHPEIGTEFAKASLTGNQNRTAELSVQTLGNALSANYAKRHKITTVATEAEADGTTKMTANQIAVAAIADYQRKKHPELKDIKDNKEALLNGLALETVNKYKLEHPNATEQKLALIGESAVLTHYLAVANANATEIYASNPEITKRLQDAFQNENLEEYQKASRDLQREVIINTVTNGASDNANEKELAKQHQAPDAATQQEVEAKSNANGTTELNNAVEQVTKASDATPAITTEEAEATAEFQESITPQQREIENIVANAQPHNAVRENAKLDDVPVVKRGTINLSQNNKGRSSKEATRIQEAFVAFGFDATEVDIADITGESQKTAQAIAEIGKKLTGLKPIFYRNNGEGLGEYGAARGGYIFLNADNIGNEAEAADTLGHEFLHYVKEWSPKLYDILRNAVMEYTNSKPAVKQKFDEFCKNMRQDIINNDYNIHLLEPQNEAAFYEWAEEEWVARRSGELFTNNDFLTESLTIANRIKPGTAEKLLKSLKAFLNKLLAIFRSKGVNVKSEDYNKIYNTFKDVVSRVVALSKTESTATSTIQQEVTQNTAPETVGAAQATNTTDTTAAETEELDLFSAPAVVQETPQQQATEQPVATPVAQTTQQAEAQPQQIQNVSDNSNTKTIKELGNNFVEIGGKKFYEPTPGAGYFPVRESAKENPVVEVHTSTNKNPMIVKLQYELVPISQVIISADKNFDQDLQPRNVDGNLNREERVTEMAQNLSPDLLFDSALTSNGSPIIDENNMAMTGNTRMEALRRVMTNSKLADKKEAYRTALLDFAYRNSIFVPPASETDPLVLVRRPVENMTKEEKVDFVNKSNESSVAEMIDTEEAYNDAKRIKEQDLLKDFPSDISGKLNLNSRAMADFVSALQIGLPNTSAWYMSSGRGLLTEKGVSRIENALLATLFVDIKEEGLSAQAITEKVMNASGISRAKNAVTNALSLLINLRRNQIILNNGAAKDTDVTTVASYDIMPIIGKALNTLIDFNIHKQNFEEDAKKNDLNPKEAYATEQAYLESRLNAFFAEQALPGISKDATRSTEILVRVFALPNNKTGDIQTMLTKYIEKARVALMNEQDSVVDYDGGLFGVSEEEKSETPIYEILQGVTLDTLGISVELPATTPSHQEIIDNANEQEEPASSVTNKDDAVNENEDEETPSLFGDNAELTSEAQNIVSTNKPVNLGAVIEAAYIAAETERKEPEAEIAVQEQKPATTATATEQKDDKKTESAQDKIGKKYGRPELKPTEDNPSGIIQEEEVAYLDRLKDKFIKSDSKTLRRIFASSQTQEDIEMMVNQILPKAEQQKSKTLYHLLIEYLDCLNRIQNKEQINAQLRYEAQQAKTVEESETGDASASGNVAVTKDSNGNTLVIANSKATASTEPEQTKLFYRAAISKDKEGRKYYNDKVPVELTLTEDLSNAIKTVQSTLLKALQGNDAALANTQSYIDAINEIRKEMMSAYKQETNEGDIFSDSFDQAVFGTSTLGSMTFVERVAEDFINNKAKNIDTFKTDFLRYLANKINNVAKGNWSNLSKSASNSNLSLDADTGKGKEGDSVRLGGSIAASVNEGANNPIENLRGQIDAMLTNLEEIRKARNAGDISNSKGAADARYSRMKLLFEYLKAQDDTKIVEAMKILNSPKRYGAFLKANNKEYSDTSRDLKMIRSLWERVKAKEEGTKAGQAEILHPFVPSDEFATLARFEEKYPAITLKTTPVQILPQETVEDKRTLYFNMGGRIGISRMKKANEYLDNLRKAQIMRKNGRTATEIFRATGWEYNKVDKKWRTEIGDAVIDLDTDRIIDYIDSHFTQMDIRLCNIITAATRWSKNDSKIMLNKNVKNQEIFEAYPELNDVGIRFNNRVPNNSGGNDNKTKTIFLNNNSEVFSNIIDELVSIITSKSSKNWRELATAKIEELDREINETIVHEVQHNIQRVEGFASGGSAAIFDLARFRKFRDQVIASNSDMQQTVTDNLNIIAEKINKIKSLNLQQEVEDAYELYSSTDDYAYIEDVAGLSDNPSFANAVFAYAKARDRYNEALEKANFAAYYKLAGEVEARNAEFRLSELTPQERKLISFEESEIASAKGNKYVQYLGLDMSRDTQININNILKKAFVKTNSQLLNEQVRNIDNHEQYRQGVADEHIRFKTKGTTESIFGADVQQVGTEEYDAPVSNVNVADHILSTFQNMRGNIKVKNEREDLSAAADLWASLPAFYRDKTRQSQYFYRCVDDMSRTKTELENDLLDYRGVNGMSAVERIETLKNKDKAAYDKVMRYLVQKDRASDGLTVTEENVGDPVYMIRTKDGTTILATYPTHKEAVEAKEKFRGKYYDTVIVKHYNDTKYKVKNADGKVLAEFNSHETAWLDVFQRENADLMNESKFSQEMADAVMEYRQTMYRCYILQKAATIDAIEEKIVQRGEDFKKWLKYKGNEKWLNIYEEYAEMGQHLATYMPRIRKGRYFVDAEKTDTDGKQLRIKEAFDSRITANSRKQELIKDGWSNVTIEKNESLTSEVRVSGLSLANTEIIINDALRRLDDFADTPPTEFGLGYHVYNSTRSKNRRVIEFMFLPDCSQEVRDVIGKISGGKRFNGGVSFRVDKDNVDEFKNFVLELLHQATGTQTIQERFAEEIQSEWAISLMSSSSRSRRIQRQKKFGKEVVTGYIEDPMKAMKLYIASLASAQAKTKFSINAMKVFGGSYYTTEDFMREHYPQTPIEEMTPDMFLEFLAERKKCGIQPALQPNLYSDVMSSWKHLLQNPTKVDEVINAVNGLTALDMLSGASSGMVNMLALATTLPAAIGKYTGESMFVASMRVHKYCIPYWSFIAQVKGKKLGWKKGNIDLGSRTAEMFSIIEEYGMTGDTLSAQTLASADKTAFQKLYKGYQNTAMFAFAMTERGSRAAGICAAYDALCDKIKREQGKDALPKTREEKVNLMFEAKRIAEMGLADFSKGNQSWLIRGERKALRIPFLFMTYSINQMNLLLKHDNTTARRHAASAIWLMASTMLLGGIKVGIPLALIKLIIDALDGDADGEDDPEEWFSKKLLSLFNVDSRDDEWYGIVDRFSRYGLVGATTNVNVSNSMNMFEFLNVFDGVNSFEDAADNVGRKMLGASGSNIMNKYQGIKALMQGDYLRGAEFMLPKIAAAPIKAYREHTTGMTTRNGRPVLYDGEPIIIGADKEWYASCEFFARALGFNPARVAKMREQQFKLNNLRYKYKEMRSEILEDAAKIAYDNNWRIDTKSEEWKKIMNDVDEFNKRLKEKDIPQSMAKPITSSTISQSLKTRRRNQARKTDSQDYGQVHGYDE